MTRPLTRDEISPVYVLPLTQDDTDEMLLRTLRACPGGLDDMDRVALYLSELGVSLCRVGASLPDAIREALS